jgi:hypothetical protein
VGLSIADRVRDTTTSTGTGNITLAGAPPTGFRAFSAVMSINDNCYYAIVGGAEWEVGYGTLSASTTLVRSRVIDSSAGVGVAVTFSAGTKDVFQTIAARTVQPRGMVWAISNGFALQ